MAKDLGKGTKLKSLYNIDIIVDKKIGEGRQGYVYLIDYGGQPKALKIYKPASLRDPKAFYKNVLNNVKKGAPNASFLWPQDMLKWNGTTFGYIMDLRPSEYVELVDFMNDKKPNVRFSSFKAAATAAMEMTSAFRILHSKGFSYQDLSDGNFFINPANGKVLICDNDNVSKYGENTNILGTPQYMAPEIVRGEAKPSTFTDRFSLSVVIFIILTMSHPLEGSRHLCEILTPKLERILYGTEPIFILDPSDRRNAPVAGVHNNIGRVWPELPKYMKDMFYMQFSKEIMMNPQRRATEGEWLEVLTRFCSDIVKCPHCGGDNLKHDEAKPVCSCGKPLPFRNRLAPSGVSYTVPAAYGTIIYRNQLGPSDIEHDLDRILLVRNHPSVPNTLVMQNISGTDLSVIKPDGTRVLFKNGAAAGIVPGTIVEGFGGSVKVR